MKPFLPEYFIIPFGTVLKYSCGVKCKFFIFKAKSCVHFTLYIKYENINSTNVYKRAFPHADIMC